MAQHGPPAPQPPIVVLLFLPGRGRGWEVAIFFSSSSEVFFCAGFPFCLLCTLSPLQERAVHSFFRALLVELPLRRLIYVISDALSLSLSLSIEAWYGLPRRQPGLLLDSCDRPAGFSVQRRRDGGSANLLLPRDAPSRRVSVLFARRAPACRTSR